MNRLRTVQVNDKQTISRSNFEFIDGTLKIKSRLEGSHLERKFLSMMEINPNKIETPKSMSLSQLLEKNQAIKAESRGSLFKRNQSVNVIEGSKEMLDIRGNLSHRSLHKASEITSPLPSAKRRGSIRTQLRRIYKNEAYND